MCFNVCANVADENTVNGLFIALLVNAVVVVKTVKRVFFFKYKTVMFDFENDKGLFELIFFPF